MSAFEVPEDLQYIDTHEWIRVADGRVGISAFAQDELGDVVFVELPEVGTDLAKDEEFGVVESIKAVSDLYAPVSGTVTAVNDALADSPELVNEDPYGEGWMLELELADEDELDELLSPEEYEDRIA